MTPHTLLASFAIVVLATLAYIGKSSKELGYRQRMPNTVPPPVPLVLPEPGTLAPTDQFERREYDGSLPRGLVSIPGR